MKEMRVKNLAISIDKVNIFLQKSNEIDSSKKTTSNTTIKKASKSHFTNLKSGLNHPTIDLNPPEL